MSNAVVWRWIHSTFLCIVIPVSGEAGMLTYNAVELKALDFDWPPATQTCSQDIVYVLAVATSARSQPAVAPVSADADVDELFDMYSMVLHHIADQLAPSHALRWCPGRATPWFDAECGVQTFITTTVAFNELDVQVALRRYWLN